VPRAARQSRAAHRLGSRGTHKSPSVLPKASLQRGLSGSQELLITEVRRITAQWNKLL